MICVSLLPYPRIIARPSRKMGLLCGLQGQMAPFQQMGASKPHLSSNHYYSIHRRRCTAFSEFPTPRSSLHRSPDAYLSHPAALCPTARFQDRRRKKRPLQKQRPFRFNFWYGSPVFPHSAPLPAWSRSRWDGSGWWRSAPPPWLPDGLPAHPLKSGRWRAAR